MVVQRRIVAVLGPELDMLESSSTSSMSGRYWKKKDTFDICKHFRVLCFWIDQVLSMW